MISAARKLSGGDLGRKAGALALRARAAVLWRIHLAANMAFDRRWGVETVRRLDRTDVGMSAEEYGTHEMYVPAPTALFPIFASLVPKADRARFSFYDVGAGKGGQMIAARAAGFASVLGVENEPSLAAQGRRNLIAAFGEGAPARMECADATVFPIPEGDVFLLLYNPFWGEPFARFVEHLRAAAKDRTGEIIVCYVNPVCADRLDAAPEFERISFAAGARVALAGLCYHRVLAWRAAHPA